MPDGGSFPTLDLILRRFHCGTGSTTATAQASLTTSPVTRPTSARSLKLSILSSSALMVRVAHVTLSTLLSSQLTFLWLHGEMHYVGVPEADAYFTGDCSGEPQVVPMDTECDAIAAIPADDDYEPPFVNPPPSVATTAFPTPASSETPYKTVYFCAGYNPTTEPVAEPTPFPTGSVAAPVKFGVTQVNSRDLHVCTDRSAF